MKRRLLILALVAVFAGIFGTAPIARTAIPLQTAPAWTSTPNGHFATGGAWHDVDGDGWLDMIVAVGNDMARQPVVVYHNNGDGTLPLNPTWTSNDIDYHGHVDLGDVNGDGLADLAVGVFLGPNRFGDPGWAKVYFNNGAGAFDPDPGWISSERFVCFSVAFGDADGDGDLDLAAACGTDYYGDPLKQRVFYNQAGVLDTVSVWKSETAIYGMDVFWDDVDLDGDLDLVFGGASSPTQLYLNHATIGGGLDTTAAWSCADASHANTVAFGDWDGDSYPDLAVADNYQNGGVGEFKVYANGSGTLATTPGWTSGDGGYGSHVSWADLDLDGDLDLATGRWWGAGRVYENLGGTLAVTPMWTSDVVPVVENMFWGDVDNDGLRTDGLSSMVGDGVRTFFDLGQSPVRSVDAVRVNGVPVTGYATHAANGWVTLTTAPAAGSAVTVEFTYSMDLDLGMTNWASGEGNYLFLNAQTSAVGGSSPVARLVAVVPNPMRSLAKIRYRGEAASTARVAVYDAMGRRVRTLHEGPVSDGLTIWEWNRRDNAGRSVAAGVFYGALETPVFRETFKLVVVN